MENNNVSRRASIMARQSTLTTDPTCWEKKVGPQTCESSYVMVLVTSAQPWCHQTVTKPLDYKRFTQSFGIEMILGGVEGGGEVIISGVPPVIHIATRLKTTDV